MLVCRFFGHDFKFVKEISVEDADDWFSWNPLVLECRRCNYRPSDPLERRNA